MTMVGLGSVMALLAPWPLAILVDAVLGDKPLPSLLGSLEGVSRYELLVFAVIAGLVVTALIHGLAVIDEYVNTKLDQSIVLDLRSQMMVHAQRLSLAALTAAVAGGFALGTWAFVPAAVALVCVAVFAATECGIAASAASAALFTTSEDPS
jgi:ABC-type multidrug transport system fused ATPase/permease subunit